jgi:soluble lytic murein transglycosylase-like protein
MLRTTFAILLMTALIWGHAWAPPLGAAQHHAAMQEAAPYARRYHLRLPLADAVVRAADRAHVPRGIAFRLVHVESSFDSLAVSGTGALGLTQVLPSTGRRVCPGRDLLQTDDNLECGFTYLQQMHQRYHDWYIATAAYNLGPAVADTSKTLNDLRYSQLIVGAF